MSTKSSCTYGPWHRRPCPANAPRSRRQSPRPFRPHRQRWIGSPRDCPPRGGINPTDLNAVQEAVVGDVIHHQTDFVGVPTHRHRAGGIFIADRREAVPIRVVPTLVGPLTGVVGPQLLPLTFKSGGAGRVEEGSEERKRF